jgi:hypothetical protein
MTKKDIEILNQMSDGNHLNDSEIKRANQLVHIFKSYLKPFNTYNGWTNYETWRINCELLYDTETIQELAENCYTVKDLADKMKDYVLSEIDRECKNIITLGYADVFVSNCNFYEIATHYTELLFNINED